MVHFYKNMNILFEFVGRVIFGAAFSMYGLGVILCG
jgi:hypothetical protein